MHLPGKRHNEKITLSLLAISLLNASAAFADTITPVPAAIANHNGPVRIAIIRNLDSDDNTSQFIAGTMQEGRKLGFKISTFRSNGDDARFQGFVNQAISQKYAALSCHTAKIPKRPRW